MVCLHAVREMAARLLGILTMALSADSASGLLGQLTVAQDKSSKFESREGNLTAAGFVLAQLLMGTRNHSPPYIGFEMSHDAALHCRLQEVFCVDAQVSVNLSCTLGQIQMLLCKYRVGVAVSGVPSIPEQALGSAVQSLCTAAQDTKSNHAATAALALGHAGLQSTLPLRISLDGRATVPNLALPSPVVIHR